MAILINTRYQRGGMFAPFKQGGPPNVVRRINIWLLITKFIELTPHLSKLEVGGM